MRFAITILLCLLVATTAFAGDKVRTEQPQAISKGALDCTNAIPIACGGTASGDNTGMPNNVVNYSCTTYNENGGEVVYELVLPGPECNIVTVTMTPLEGDDLDLFFLGSCEETDCIDHSTTISTETIETPCLVPGTYYIVVDGYGYSPPGAEGPFDIQVECTVCECPEEPCCPSIYVCYVEDFNISGCGFYTEDCGGPGSCFWEWGQPVFDLGSYYGPVPDVACDGVAVTNLLATDLDAYYGNCGERAIIGPYDITESCWCMELCHYYDTEPDYDGGNVKVSADGGATWSLVYPARGYDLTANGSPPCVALEPVFSGHNVASAGAFVRDCFDLSQYVGQTIMIAFDFGGDSIIFYPGWYIKWVKIGSDEFSPVEQSTWGNIKAMYR